jgi:hypothetical protein
MFRIFAALLLLSFIIIGCESDLTPTQVIAVVTPTGEEVAVPVDIIPTSIAPTETVVPTAASPTDEPPTAAPPPTVAPTDVPTIIPTEPPALIEDLAISAENITLYPVPQLYTGDFATFQIAAQLPDNLNPYEVPVQILVDGNIIVDEPLGGWRNLNGDTVGLFQWVWEVGATVGDYTIDVILDPLDEIIDGDSNPDNNVATLTVSVASKQTLPELAQDQRWETYDSAYAKIHVVTGTAAHRDREMLINMVDAAVLEAANALNVQPVVDRKVEIFFIDRVIGQGGYAGGAMVISYLDRNYSGGGLYEVLVHESIHVLDANLEPQDRFSFLAEGLATYGTGGHYKVENLDQRVAGLLFDTDRYIPLETLINDFYPAQHEIGYLEAGAFLNYLAAIYGREKLLTFYKEVAYINGKSIAESMSDAMVREFGKTLAQLETDWHAYLQTLPRSADSVTDLTLTIDYYNLMRDYQQRYDPTAHYLYAWLPSPQALLERGQTASVTRHPQTIESVALEAMLESADNALRSADYTQTRVLLDSISRTLNNGQFIDPLAAGYLQIARTAASLGYEAQDITFTTVAGQPKAIIQATDPATNQLIPLMLILENSEWIVTQ